MAYDYGRTGSFGLSFFDRFSAGFGIAAVNFYRFPVPGTVFRGDIFRIYGIDHSGKLHGVAVIEHDQVAQPEESGYTASAL